MLDEICEYLQNWFVPEPKQDNFISDTFEISDGTLTIPNCQNGQYFRIKNSLFNDGVYQYPISDLTDEIFNGEIWLMAIPKNILELNTKITAFIAENKKGGFNSESFGGYSYNKATNSDGNIAGWQDVFKDDLKPYKKLKI